jgi:hypothetical protein
MTATVFAGRFAAGFAAAVALASAAACGGTPTGRPAPSPAVPVSPAPAAKQRFADATAADYTSAVKVLSFDPDVRSVVVELVIFMPGPDYCASFGVSPVDARCGRDYVVEDSHTKVGLPLAAKATLRTTRGGDDRCIGTMAAGGTCKATVDSFAAALHETPGMPARLTVRNGEVVTLAQIYTS